jgi:hypothetical protein
MEMGVEAIGPIHRAPVIIWLGGPTPGDAGAGQGGGGAGPQPEGRKGTGRLPRSAGVGGGGVAMGDRGALLNFVPGHCFCAQVVSSQPD